MKFKITAVAVSLLIANSVSAQNLPYYSVEEINVNADGTSFGPYPVATSEDGSVIITHSMKASLSSNIDIGLPFTFNRACQYDRIICELEFDGSETAGHLSYENAYKAWRNAQSDADTNGYTSYMMANVLSDCPVIGVPYSASIADFSCSDNSQAPFDIGDTNTDVKVTGLYQADTDSEVFIIGHSSDAYVNNKRVFVRRAFIKTIAGEAIELLPDFRNNGGFSSAYNIQKVGDKVLVIGHASVSFPKDNSEYFDNCYSSNEYDDRYNFNELTDCPGFDTQAWGWDVTDIVNGNNTDQPIGSELASQWLEGKTSPAGDSTFSANAAAINSSGIAVGASSFEYRNNNEGARERAIIMTPTNGEYGAPEELTAATDDIEDQEDWIYNSWAVTVSESGIITGNREYDTSKGRNKATEFFVYNNMNKMIQFPLKDKKVASTKQRAENSGSYYTSKKGANSRVYDANEGGFVVGEVDDYDQVNPAYEGSPRVQAAFLFNNNDNQAWLMNDLICNQDATTGVVESPLIRIITARVINEEGVVLANGFTYPTVNDYKYKTNAVQAAFRLIPNAAVTSPNDSPNCWESELLKTTEETYERQGGATFWLWLFALPLLLIRRFKG